MSLLTNSNDLRPKYLVDFVGKQKLKENLQTFIASAIKRCTSLDHILFYGVPGTGKTSLAMIIANELNTKVHIIQGHMLMKNVDVINLLSLIKENDVVFIDEIHSCNPNVFETLYSVMEDFAIDVCLGKEFNSKVTRLKIPRFTLIGATTTLGKVAKPLEDRFGFLFYLGEYDNNEIFELLKINALKLDISLADDEIEKIASVSKGIPRIANRILKRTYDFKMVNNNNTVDYILKQINIGDDGFEECDVNYIKVLYDYESEVGLKTISQIMNIDQLTIEQKIEPFLIKNGYIIKNLKGRKLTSKGFNYVKNNLIN